MPIKKLVDVEFYDDPDPLIAARAFDISQNITFAADVPAIGFPNDLTLIRQTQKVIMYFDWSSQNRQDTLDTILNLLQNRGPASSHKVTILVPSQEDDDFSSFNVGSFIADSFSYYNFRNEEYESLSEVIDEKELPNFLVGGLWRYGEETPEQIEKYTMHGAIPDVYNNQALMLSPSVPINMYEFDEDYFDTTNAYIDDVYETKVDYFKTFISQSAADRSTYAQANNHVFVDYRYGDAAQSKYIGNVPFFNRIRTPSRLPPVFPPNLIVDAFRDCNMSNQLLESFRNANTITKVFRSAGRDEEVEVYDLIEAWSGMGYNSIVDGPDEMMLRRKNTFYASSDSNIIGYYFNKLQLFGKIAAIAETKMRKFEDIIYGTGEHDYEFLGYKVIKTLENSETPIQTFYFLNYANLRDFIDTQIKFDTSYNYKINGMYLIFGSNYEYQNIEQVVVPNPNAPLRIQFDFVVTPSLKIAEVPVVIHTMRVVEPPPIVPEVTFYNEKDKKNKLKIRLEHQDGNIVDEYNWAPLRPFRNNGGYIEKLKQYFKTDSILAFSGKTSIGAYEIYRLDRPPESYLDFENALLTTVFPTVTYSNGDTAKSVMYTDMIKHQKKYYYAFRAITHRGNNSELSPIYVVEMYEDADETFMTFDLYEIPKPKKLTKYSHMRKYIQIIPNLEHVEVNEEELLANHQSAETAINDLSLGNKLLEEKLFEFNSSKKFIKLRLESNNSGRKLDLNLFFKKKQQN